MKLGRLGSSVYKHWSAKDYVQDGLVAMWDGIENAGWGVHDASSTTWTNLIAGSEPLPLPSTWSFSQTEPCLVMKRSYRWTVPNTYFASAYGIDGWHVEIVVLPTMEDTNGDSGFFIFTGSVGWWMRPNQFRTRNHANETVIISSPKKINCGVRPAPDDPYYVEYLLNGEMFLREKVTFNVDISKFTVFETWPNQLKGYTMKLYSFRIYNRALTPDEMVSNYRIDKYRFNLP